MVMDLLLVFDLQRGLAVQDALLGVHFPCLPGSVVLCLTYTLLPGQTAKDDKGQ